MDRDPLTGVPPSRHPMQIWILAACVLNGFFIILQVDEPPAMAGLLPHYAITAWGVILLVVGVAGIVAAFLPDRITGLLLERIALGGLSGATFVYSSAIVGFSGLSGFAAAIFLASVGVAGAWRIRHVGRELDTLEQWRSRQEEIKRLRVEHQRLLENGYGEEGRAGEERDRGV